MVVFARANEICAISVRAGSAIVYRGAIPPALWNDITDVVRRARVENATLRILKDRGAARLIAKGIDAPTAQQLRNAIGAIPYRILAGSRPRAGTRNLGQRLGIAWLAWRLDARGRR
jgi:hypothetical protein